MNKIGLVAWITYKDSLRNKALYGIFGLGVVMFLTNSIITGMFSWELGKVATDVGLSVVSVSGLILIFFFSIHMVSNDLERKTIYIILSKPISKKQYILGKFAGLAFVILISSIVLGLFSMASIKLATLGAGAYIPQGFSWTKLVIALVYITLSLLVLLAIAFLCISVTTHPFTALLLCMMLYFIGQNVETVTNIIQRYKMFMENKPLLLAVKFISWLVPNLAAFDLKTTAAYGLPIEGSYLAWVAVYGIAYIIICLVFTIWIFQKRELG